MIQETEKLLTDDLDRFERSVDRFFDSFFPSQPRFRPISWHPPTDVYETEEGVIVKIEIAGMEPQDFEISYLEQILTVHGERRDTGANKTVPHLLEITYGEFEIEVKLPGAYVESEISAKYENGFLCVTLPKPREQTHTPLRIRVK